MEAGIYRFFQRVVNVELPCGSKGVFRSAGRFLQCSFQPRRFNPGPGEASKADSSESMGFASRSVHIPERPAAHCGAAAAFPAFLPGVPWASLPGNRLRGKTAKYTRCVRSFYPSICRWQTGDKRRKSEWRFHSCRKPTRPPNPNAAHSPPAQPSQGAPR